MKSLIMFLIVGIVGVIVFIFWKDMPKSKGFEVNIRSDKNIKTQATPSSLRFSTPFDKHEQGKSRGSVLSESAKHFQNK